VFGCKNRTKCQIFEGKGIFLNKGKPPHVCFARQTAWTSGVWAILHHSVPNNGIPYRTPTWTIYHSSVKTMFYVLSQPLGIACLVEHHLNDRGNIKYIRRLRCRFSSQNPPTPQNFVYTKKLTTIATTIRVNFARLLV